MFIFLNLIPLFKRVVATIKINNKNISLKFKHHLSKLKKSLTSGIISTLNHVNVCGHNLKS